MAPLYLPTEILLNIISQLEWTDQKTLVNLTATSRVFRELALPKLYRAPYSADWRLLRTLFENPAFGCHVKEFTLHCDNIGDEDEEAGWFADNNFEEWIPIAKELHASESEETACREDFLEKVFAEFGIPSGSPLWEASMYTRAWGGWCFLFLYVMPALQVLSINSSAHAVRLLFPQFFESNPDNPTPAPRCLSTIHTITHTSPHPPRYFQMGPSTLYPLIFLPSIRNITLSRPIAFSTNPFREELRQRQNARPSYIPSDFQSTLQSLTILVSFMPPSALECILHLTPNLVHFRHDDATPIDTWGAEEYLGPVLHRTIAKSLVYLDLRRLSPREHVEQIDLSDLSQPEREEYLQEIVDNERLEDSELNCFSRWWRDFEKLETVILNKKYWKKTESVPLRGLGDMGETDTFPPRLVRLCVSEAGESWREPWLYK